MDFPAYVPEAVREKITSFLEGEPDRGMPGFIELLKRDKARLAELEISLNEWEQRVISIPDSDMPSAYRKKIAELRKDKAELVKRLGQLIGDVDCLHRLAHDARMREAYALLTREFTDDQQWRDFIYAAWSARVDFAKYRDRLKRATKLKGEIAEAAEALAKLIRQFADTGVYGPAEFYSIPELLRQTDNHEMQGHNFYMWRDMRQHVLGDRIDALIVRLEGGGEADAIVIINPRDFVSPENAEDGKIEVDPKEEARNTLRYAWESAPPLAALLDTVAGAARAFEPCETGMIGAAIQSRQRSPKTEYLRAFGNLLTDVHKFALTTPIMQAMAIVANVVINLPDVDVTYDDVRKATARLGGERLENSGEK